MDILFWSGGKDSYLALEFYKKEHDKDQLRLLTTFNEETDIVPHQNIAIEDIREQVRNLDLELLLVPLPSECPNDEYLQRISAKISEEAEPVNRLIFGDWRLRDIREWREQVFADMGYTCLFPIWEKDIHELMAVLMLKPVQVTISSVQDKYQKYIRVGEPYNQRFLQQLPDDIDPMGENGEFHTKVAIQSFDDVNPPSQLLY